MPSPLIRIIAITFEPSQKVLDRLAVIYWLSKPQSSPAAQGGKKSTPVFFLGTLVGTARDLLTDRQLGEIWPTRSKSTIGVRARGK